MLGVQIGMRYPVNRDVLARGPVVVGPGKGEDLLVESRCERDWSVIALRSCTVV